MTRSDEYRRDAQEAFREAVNIILAAREKLRRSEEHERFPSLTGYAMEALYDEVRAILVRADTIQARL